MISDGGGGGFASSFLQETTLNRNLFSCYFSNTMRNGIFPAILVNKGITVISNCKITADGDRGQEIKRHFLLERKTMTNLDSILESRDITLPTKVQLVKAMVFPIVVYGCESWTIKKAEHRRIDAFEL